MKCACTALCFLHQGSFVASQYAPVQYRDATILVMGYSGHGKSTALNAMADTKKAFHVCAGKGGCTKDVASEMFHRMVLGSDGLEYQVNLTVVDTPGFPDHSGNAEINDAVFDATRQWLNAVVWVVKPRSSSAVTQQERALFDEFNRLNVPIFQLVNGRKVYKNATDRTKRRRVDKANMLVMADEMAKSAGLSITGRFLSTTKADLKDETQAIIYRSLSYPSRTSSFRSVEDIEGTVSEAKRHHPRGQESEIGSKEESAMQQKDEL